MTGGRSQRAGRRGGWWECRISAIDPNLLRSFSNCLHERPIVRTRTRAIVTVLVVAGCLAALGFQAAAPNRPKCVGIAVVPLDKGAEHWHEVQLIRAFDDGSVEYAKLAKGDTPAKLLWSKGR
jgi:hypothetical protein